MPQGVHVKSRDLHCATSPHGLLKLKLGGGVGDTTRIALKKRGLEIMGQEERTAKGTDNLE